MEWTLVLTIILLPIGVGLLAGVYGYSIGRAHAAEARRYGELDY